MDSSKVPAPQEIKLHFLDYWRIIRIRKTVILAVFLLVVITATVVTYILPESFSAKACIKVEQDAPDIPFVDYQGFRRPFDPHFILTEFEVLQSEVILGEVVEKLNLCEEWGKKYNNGVPLKRHVAMDVLEKSMDVRQKRNTSIIEILVYSDTPEEAARLANAIAETYRDHRLKLVDERAARGIEKLADQKKKHDEELAAQRLKVDQLRTSLGIVDLDPHGTTPTPTFSSEQLRTLQNQLLLLTDLQVKQQTTLSNLLQYDKEELRNSIQTALDQPDATLMAYFNSLNEAEQVFRSVSRDYNEAHALYQNAQSNIAEILTKIDERIKGILLGLETRLAETTSRVVQLSNALETAKKADLEMAETSRAYYAEKQKLAELLQFNTVLGLRIAAQQTERALPRNAMVVITDHAFADERPVKPKKGLNIALGIIIGLVVGVGLAFFIEYLDTSVKTIDDVERTLQAPVLGVIPQNVGFLLEEGAESPHAEAYRVLRTNLLFSRKDDKLNTIAIVSAGAGEGKSTTVVNLATVFAQSGNRVVVVDSDLRRPTLHKILQVSNSIGLTNYLLRQNTLEEVIQTTSLPTLDFMPSGKLPSSSMGVLSSAQMKDLIQELKQRYDYVFFDSPPIMGVSDASILASEVDLTLQVIQYRRYPQPMNIRAKQMIEKVGGNLLGIVLNNINMSQDESYYYYSGYYHEYYSKNEEETESAETAGDDVAKIDIKPKY
ncbi:MAG TPA: polysaccharide biosynthesis tyrosine autokinase [Verrucomicrobia bacterium]|nr:polysaccharide biosynthesis tyrosine autokinase [Verrucomicrobiota bacterium]